LLVINDGSTDNSAAYLDQLSDPRIRVVHQANQGLAGSLNVGLGLCETEYLARLDSDDIALPTRLEKQLAYLKRHPRMGLVGTQFAWRFENRAGGGGPLPCDDATIDAFLMQGRHAMCHSSIMCRTTLLREIGGYWSEGVAEDWDMYLRMSERAEFANLDEVLLHVGIVEHGLQSAQMAEVRSRIAFACELARRRRRQMDPISYAEFCGRRRADPWWQRLAEALNVHALMQYRKAQPEILGRRPIRGYARLGFAAACSPALTMQRIMRILRYAGSSQ
jgi:glycosyltransferase involved in cell wall biosynthesis